MSFARTIQRTHFSRHPLDGTISRMAWTNYISSLDPDHTILTESDLTGFKNRTTMLSDDLRKGNLTFAFDALETLRKRARESRNPLAETLSIADPEWILQKYLTAFARAYDPFSEYLCPSIVEDQNLRRQHSLVGIGALLSMESDGARVISLVPGGPAARDTGPARLQAGDRITAVAQGDGPPEPLAGKSLAGILSLTRGRKGTPITLTAVSTIPGGKPVARIVRLTRDEITSEAPPARGDVKMITLQTGQSVKLGIISLPALYGEGETRRGRHAKSSARDVAMIIRQFQAKKVDGILLDMRNNGGGSLPEAIVMSGLFLRSGPVLRISDGTRVDTLGDPDPGIAYAGPLVVLVNRYTASASELVAATLQDYGRAVITGNSRTYGKGICQNTFFLGRNARCGALRVTTTSYFRISGKSLHAKGVEPDVRIMLPEPRTEAQEASTSVSLRISAQDKADYSPVADLSAAIRKLNEASQLRMKDKPAAGAGETDAMLVEGLAILADFTAIAETDALKFDQGPPPGSKGLLQTVLDWF